MSYSGDPSSSDRDRIRFLLQDTSGNATIELFLDAEIDGYLTIQPNVLLAAADLAEVLAAKRGQLIDHTVLSTSVSIGPSTDFLLALADRLRRQASKRCTILVGGRTIAGNHELDIDPTLRRPQFKLEMDDNRSDPGPSGDNCP